jgi:hypothetical protein
MARKRIEHSVSGSSARLLLLGALLSAAVHPGHAQPSQEILRQRLPDGSVVFTDRPQSGGKTEKRWNFDSEDPAAAAARRAELRSESATVSERIARQQADERERELQAELARSRAAQAAAEREAALARAEAANPPSYFTGPVFWPWPVRPPHPYPGGGVWEPPVIGKPRPPGQFVPPRPPGQFVPPRPPGQYVPPRSWP